MSLDTPLLDVRGLDVDIAGEAGMTHAVKRLELAIWQRQTFALVGESAAARASRRWRCCGCCRMPAVS